VSRLITDLDLMTGRVTSPIVLSAGVLITPAARDRAIANGLVIVERDGSVVGAATAKPAQAGKLLTEQAAPTEQAAAARPCGCKGSSPEAPVAKAGCSCGGGCGSGCGCRKPPLPDGLHLVRVDAGRVTWSRPVSGETPATPAF
jgi:hypothetical protein